MRADAIATKRDAARLFAASSSGRVLSVVVIGAVTIRIVLAVTGAARPAITDLVVVVTGALLVGPIEWFVHRHLLHADADGWMDRRLGVGRGHRRHHLDPPDVTWILLPGVEAGVFSILLGVFVASWAAPLGAVGGGSILGSTATGVAVAWLALWHYEWTHLLVHTRYRPRTRLYARLARHHRLHHYRNENFWLGVTSNTGDRLARTLPGDRTSVPLSPTARSLGV